MANSQRSAFAKRIDHDKLAKFSPVLKIFTVEAGATSFQSSGDDERIVKGHAMIARQRNSSGMHVACQRHDLGETRVDEGDRALDVNPPAPQLAP